MSCIPTKCTTEERSLPGTESYKRCPCSSVGVLSHPCCCVFPVFSKQMCPINNTSPYGPLQRERGTSSRSAGVPAHAQVCANTRSEKHHKGQLHYVRTTSPAPLDIPLLSPPPPSAVLRHLPVLVLNAHSSCISCFYMMIHVCLWCHLRNENPCMSKASSICLFYE